MDYEFQTINETANIFNFTISPGTTRSFEVVIVGDSIAENICLIIYMYNMVLLALVEETLSLKKMMVSEMLTIIDELNESTEVQTLGIYLFTRETTEALHVTLPYVRTGVYGKYKLVIYT